MRPRPQGAAKSLVASGVGDIEAVLYAQRGITFDRIRSFSAPTLADISDPLSIPGIAEAASVIEKALGEGADYPAAIIGDYDADGIMASSIVKKMLAEMGCHDCDVFLPSRQKEGYGLNDDTLQSFVDEFPIPNLLIVVDTGAAYGTQISSLKKWGVKHVVVLDHHIPGPQGHPTSADAYVNWRKSNSDPYCAAGEAYQLARACLKMRGLESDWLAPYAAIATVADMVPLTGDNRTIVKCGLPELWNSRSPGLISLVMNSARSGGFHQTDVAFQVGPRINAVGRMGDPDKALTLMLSGNAAECMPLVSELDAVNSQRKLAQAKMERAVRKVAEAGGWQNGILCYDPSWIPGICGLVAGKTAEEFGMPCLVFGLHDGKISGSGRSVKGASVKDIMDRCKQLFLRYGGHEMACGATLDPNRLADGAKAFDDACGDYYKEHGRPSFESLYDMELTSPEQLTPSLGFRILNSFHPYDDDANPEPVFKISNVLVHRVETKESEEWKLTSLTLGSECNKLGFEFSTFSDLDVAALDGQRVDAYFKFPQTEDEEKMRDLELVDVVLCEDIPL
jgi:single-stranded-DNA-specific exonuclease